LQDESKGPDSISGPLIIQSNFGKALSICWFATAAGLIGSALGVYIIDPAAIRSYALLPSASAKTASLAAGAAIGLAISWGLLVTGLIKRSYESEDPQDFSQNPEEPTELPFDHRLEICREITGRKIQVEWACSCRVAPVSEEMIACMADAGCRHICWGVESGSEKILKTALHGSSGSWRVLSISGWPGPLTRLL